MSAGVTPARSSTDAVIGPTTANRAECAVVEYVEHALRSVRGGDHDPVRGAAHRGPQRGTAVGGIRDRDRRHLDRLRPEHAQPRREIAALLGRPGDDDASPGQRATGLHPRTSSTSDSQQSVVRRSDSTSTRSL